MCATQNTPSRLCSHEVFGPCARPSFCVTTAATWRRVLPRVTQPAEAGAAPALARRSCACASCRCFAVSHWPALRCRRPLLRPARGLRYRRVTAAQRGVRMRLVAAVVASRCRGVRTQQRRRRAATRLGCPSARATWPLSRPCAGARARCTRPRAVRQRCRTKDTTTLRSSSHARLRRMASSPARPSACRTTRRRRLARTAAAGACPCPLPARGQ